MQRPAKVGAAPLKHYFFGPGSAGRRACLPGGGRDGWLPPNSSGRPSLPVYIGLRRSFKMAARQITTTPIQKTAIPYSTYSATRPSSTAATMAIAAMYRRKLMIAGSRSRRWLRISFHMSLFIGAAPAGRNSADVDNPSFFDLFVAPG
jgi:hypothetical protein